MGHNLGKSQKFGNVSPMQTNRPASVQTSKSSVLPARNSPICRLDLFTVGMHPICLFRRNAMQRGFCFVSLAFAVILGLSDSVSAQQPQYHYSTAYQLNQWYYYPYIYFPHNYWPAQGPRWPEAPGMPYARPPAYQAYPPFLQQNWRYELWSPQPYYRGNHFFLDQF
jgi:hypothetical protein